MSGPRWLLALVLAIFVTAGVTPAEAQVFKPRGKAGAKATKKTSAKSAKKATKKKSARRAPSKKASRKKARAIENDDDEVIITDDPE